MWCENIGKEIILIEECSVNIVDNEEYDKILSDLVFEEGDAILSIPGVYEVLSEHFNNQILEILERLKESR